MPDRAAQEQVPQAAITDAKRTAQNLSPVCDVCGVAYVDDYSGPCQEPRPPYNDLGRRCPGTVSLTPERIAEQAIAAAYPAIREKVLGEVEEALTSFDAIHALYCHLPTITTDNDAGPNDQEEADLIEAMRAALATLKDQSHVDEEACKRCGGSRRITDVSRSHGSAVPCPDCTKPAQVDEAGSSEGEVCVRCGSDRWGDPVQPVANSRGQRYVECLKCGQRRIPNRLPTENNAVTDGPTAFPGTHELPEFGELPGVQPTTGETPEAGDEDSDGLPLEVRDALFAVSNTMPHGDLNDRFVFSEFVDRVVAEFTESGNR